jgi:hypothetical protein
MTAVSDVPDVAWQKMAIRARHGVFLRVSGSWRCVLKVSAESQFLKRLPCLPGLERSEAVERLERAFRLPEGVGFNSARWKFTLNS